MDAAVVLFVSNLTGRCVEFVDAGEAVGARLMRHGGHGVVQALVPGRSATWRTCCSLSVSWSLTGNACQWATAGPSVRCGSAWETTPFWKPISWCFSSGLQRTRVRWSEPSVVDMGM